MDAEFNIKEFSQDELKGEDPRTFIHNGDVYVTDNYYSDMYITNIRTSKRTRLDVSGKNPTFISYKGNLYFFHHMMPLTIYKINVENGELEKINVPNPGNMNGEYRGGPPGYQIGEHNFYGYGHRTYIHNGLIHDPFRWDFDFETMCLKITLVKKPESAKNIMDPTSIVEINGKRYMMTAESDKAWNCEQEYITNVYQLL